uniref:Uncharacterized protein n=1 Tax=Callorhinchus milii TaxID=7868 RepID=A0A4W3IVL1_CALMI
MAAEEETLESWLNKATDPVNEEETWEFIEGFCQQVNKELEGPQIATRLLGHKIQSPQEREAMHALTVLEMCMNNCGRRFQNEAGKFRFLNDLIKVLSPKYLGTWSSEKVKSKIIEVLYSWTVWLPDEVKVRNAYQMLKKQGIIKQDPKLPDNKTLPPPPPREESSLFDDEEKSKLLARLLKSSHPEDLQAANRLIKNVIKEEQEKTEKVTKRVHAIEEVNNTTRLLNDMLTLYSGHSLPESEHEVMTALYQRCEKLRPTLFRFASDTGENDDYDTQWVLCGEPGWRGLCGQPGWLADAVWSAWLAGAVYNAVSLAGSVVPVTVFDQHGFRVLFHFAGSGPLGRPDVLVIVISMLSTSPLPISNIHFQAAVPKVMKVKLQPASGTQLPAFNPVLPPPIISQVMLLANPPKEKVRLRYKLMFTLGELPVTEVGEVADIPATASWGSL